MLELNCSYEESKKILELGYNFDKICQEFEHKDKDKYIKVNDNFYIHSESEIKGMYHNAMVRGTHYLIPIIPKAALEKCLPLIDGVIWKRFPAAGDGLLRCTGLNHRTVETCTGFHEFLWCHENYPEELKKKFDEVMA
jgi:hypothetical protein